MKTMTREKIFEELSQKKEKYTERLPIKIGNVPPKSNDKV